MSQFMSFFDMPDFETHALSEFARCTRDDRVKALQYLKLPGLKKSLAKFDYL